MKTPKNDQPKKIAKASAKVPPAVSAGIDTNAAKPSINEERGTENEQQFTRSRQRGPAYPRAQRLPEAAQRPSSNPQPSSKNPQHSTPPAPTQNPDGYLAVIDVAHHIGVWRTAVFKALNRLGLSHRRGLHPAHRRNFVALITPEQAAAVTELLESPRRGRCRAGNPHPDTDPLSHRPGQELGYYYLLQLEPEHEPLRLKGGFTNNLTERLRAFRSATPFCHFLRYYPSRRAWEVAATHSIFQRCERIHTEVYLADSLENVLKRARAFFRLMPDLTSEMLPATPPKSEHPLTPPPTKRGRKPTRPQLPPKQPTNRKYRL